MTHAVISGGILSTIVLSCAWDLRARRLPNVLTFGSALAALAVHSLDGGLPAAGLSVAGCLTGILLFLPWFLAGGMGGGDVKLLGAFGAWLGPQQTLWAGLFAMLAGGVLAAGVTLYQIARRDEGLKATTGSRGAIAYAL